LDSYKGLLFAAFDPEAPALRDYLGEVTWYLDVFFDRREGVIEVVGGMHKWTIPCNWKFSAENFSGDSYHVPWSHLSAIRAGSVLALTPGPRLPVASSLQGTAMRIVCVGPNDMTEPPMPEILAYEQEIHSEVQTRLGPRLALVSPVVGTLFPNFSSLRAGSRTFRVWHLREPDKTDVWSWVYIDRAAPPNVKEAIRLADMRGFGPSGSFEQDDMDNWQECTGACRGAVSRRAFLNTQVGLGHERFDPDLNAWASDFRMSERNHRQFYRRWGS
jgi:phenylpropionate dioxygenase-like ring-hydroxylating dioxygenase large terminal subunit